MHKIKKTRKNLSFTELRMITFVLIKNKQFPRNELMFFFFEAFLYVFLLKYAIKNVINVYY